MGSAKREQELINNKSIVFIDLDPLKKKIVNFHVISYVLNMSRFFLVAAVICGWTYCEGGCFKTTNIPPQVASAPLKECCSKEMSALSGGASYTRLKLKAAGVPSYYGNLGGAQASYEYRQRKGLYEALKFNWRQGDLANTTSKRELLDLSGEARLGYSAEKGRGTWSFFSGFGFRYLGHTVKMPNQIPIQFKYCEYYVPVGWLFDYKSSSQFHPGIQLVWMPQVDPSVDIVPYGGTRWLLRRTLRNILLEVPLRFTQFSTHNRASLEIKPFFEYWQDGHSTAISPSGLALGLPSNAYFFWGVDLNLSCSF